GGRGAAIVSVGSAARLLSRGGAAADRGRGRLCGEFAEQERAAMKIDVFNHIFPKRFFDEFINTASGPIDIGKRVRNIPTLVDLDARFRVMDEFGDYRQIISLPLPPVEELAGPEQSPLLARAANEGMAELVERYPER